MNTIYKGSFRQRKPARGSAVCERQHLGGLLDELDLVVLAFGADLRVIHADVDQEVHEAPQQQNEADKADDYVRYQFASVVGAQFL